MKNNVLFLCTGNSTRSQMAQAFMRIHGGDRFEAYSAGLDPQQVNPLVLNVMNERGVDMSEHYAKSIDEYLRKVHFSYVITLCDNADANCPSNLPDVDQRLHWPFEDPTALEGTEEEKLEKVREVRDQIEARVKKWVAGEEN